MAVILVADDRAANRQFLVTLLGYAGHSILEAADGGEALRQAQAHRPDLIISDINMPTMDGLEFVRQLRSVEAAKGVPVVMITTEGSEARVIEAISCGANGYIRKPFTPDQVKERVVPLLGDNS